MKPLELASRLNRAQQGLRFKRVASVVVLALAAAGVALFATLASAPDTAGAVSRSVERAEAARDSIEAARDRAQGASPSASAPEAGAPSQPRADAARASGAPAPSPGVIALGAGAIGALAAIALAAIWLGLALTYLALGLVAAAVGVPMLSFPSTRSLGEMTLGVAALTGAFTAASQLIRLALGRGNPVFAVARNVLMEAVRMKISLVFIVLLVFFLAGLPFFLNADQPLRYRVQMFLTYGTGGTFWTLALLTVFFAVATLTNEQRDRIIWQTMTKPVTPGQYLLGKWLGVTALNTALLGVAAAGVFLFTERLRFEPAQGEIRAYVNEDGTGEPTVDRALLETQSLTARVGVGVAPPKLDMKAIEQLADDIVNRDPPPSTRAFKHSSGKRAQMERLIGEANLQRRTISPGDSEEYVFEGLGAARRSSRPISVRFRINSGSDNPSSLFRVTFLVNDQYVIPREAPLNTSQVFDFPDDAVPRSIPPAERARFLAEARANTVDADGRMRIRVFNGDPTAGVANSRPFSFPPDGLEALYTAGSYESNFLRAAFSLWLKLAFFAAVAVGAGAFLSFPVACLVSLGVLFIAETSGYLNESLEYYIATTDLGTDYGILVSRVIAVPIALAFRWYAQLTPTASLADGRLITTGLLLKAVLSLGGGSALALALGWLVFRRRELAMYSGR